MDSSGKIVQQQIAPQPASSTATAPAAVTLSTGPGGQLVQQQFGVPQIIQGAGGTAQVAQQQIGGVPGLTMLPQIQNITLPDGQEAIFIPNNAVPSQPVMQPQASQQVGVQPAVMLPNGQIVSTGNVMTSQLTQPVQPTQTQQGQNQAQPQQQQVQTLSGIPGLTQAQGSQIVTIGGVQCVATAVPQQAQNVLQAIQMAPQIQQMQTVHMPVSTANGQTVLQAVQVPVQSLPPGVQVMGGLNVQQPGVITLGNQTVTATQLQPQQQQQQQIKPVNIKAESTTSSQEQAQIEVQSQQQQQQQQQQQMQQVQIPTLSIDSQGNITLNPAPTPVKSEAAVLGATAGLVSIGGGNVGIIQAPQTSSTPQTPTVSVASLPQPIATPSSNQNTSATPATPGGAQQVQNIILPNGQIVQGIQSPTVLNATNLQINSNGQIVQTPVVNMAGKCLAENTNLSIARSSGRKEINLNKKTLFCT